MNEERKAFLRNLWITFWENEFKNFPILTVFGSYHQLLMELNNNYNKTTRLGQLPTDLHRLMPSNNQNTTKQEYVLHSYDIRNEDLAFQHYEEIAYRLLLLKDYNKPLILDDIWQLYYFANKYLWRELWLSSKYDSTKIENIKAELKDMVLDPRYKDSYQQIKVYYDIWNMNSNYIGYWDIIEKIPCDIYIGRKMHEIACRYLNGDENENENEKNTRKTPMKDIVKSQNYTCANKPHTKISGLENYECMLWKYNKGRFDEAGYDIYEDEKGICRAYCPSCFRLKNK